MRRLRKRSGRGDGNWTRTGPLRLKCLRFTGLFVSKSPYKARFPVPRAQIATLSSTWNMLGLPWDSSVNRFAAVPKTGSALHHLGNGS